MLLPHFTRAVVFRAVAAWGFLRLCMAGISIFAAALARRPPPEEPFLVTPGTAILVVGAVAATGALFARVRNEDLFLVSLGYGRLRTVALSAAVTVLLELAATLAS